MKFKSVNKYSYTEIKVGDLVRLDRIDRKCRYEGEVINKNKDCITVEIKYGWDGDNPLIDSYCGKNVNVGCDEICMCERIDKKGS